VAWRGAVGPNIGRGLTSGARPQCQAAVLADMRAQTTQCQAVPVGTVTGLNKFQNPPNLIQTCPNLFQSKQDLPVLQKFKIKYGREVFEIRNNFPYKDFLSFKMDFELK
jgi:hypothetical protein